MSLPGSSQYQGVVVMRPHVRCLIWHPMVPLEHGHPRSRTLLGAGTLRTQTSFSGQLFPELFVSPGLPGCSCRPHHCCGASAAEQEPLRVYQDTAACRSAWGYCGKSQPPIKAGRVLEAPAETEHQQLLAQTCLCASHLAKMETEPSPHFISHIARHNAVPALKSGVMWCRQCGAPGQEPL